MLLHDTGGIDAADPYVMGGCTRNRVMFRVVVVVVVVVVLLLTTRRHTNRSHVSNIFTCVVIYSETYLSSTRNMTFSYRRAP